MTEIAGMWLASLALARSMRESLECEPERAARPERALRRPGWLRPGSVAALLRLPGRGRALRPAPAGACDDCSCRA